MPNPNLSSSLKVLFALWLVVGIQVCNTAIGQYSLLPSEYETSCNQQVMEVTSTCISCATEREMQIIRKNGYNKAGHIQKSVRYCEGGPCGKDIFVYQGDLLVAHKAFHVHQSQDVLLTKNMRWDSTQLSAKVIYTYEGKKWIGKTTYIGHEEFKTEEVRYVYYRDYRLKAEEITRYVHPDEVGTFETNSVTWNPNEGLIKKQQLKKTYKYKNNGATITFWQGDRVCATEKWTYKKDQIIASVLTSSEGHVLKKENVKYDKKGRIEKWQVQETGKDGFGKPYDFVGYQTIKYKYDNRTGMLSAKIYFKDDKKVGMERFITAERD